jgi:hypothetical protein
LEEYLNYIFCQTKIFKTDFYCWSSSNDVIYSHLNASIGFNLAAFHAGIKPKIIHIQTETEDAKNKTEFFIIA